MASPDPAAPVSSKNTEQLICAVRELIARGQRVSDYVQQIVADLETSKQITRALLKESRERRGK
jgi:hypothetical protein